MLLVTLIEDVFVRRIVMTVTCSHLPRVFYLGERCGGRGPPCRSIPTVSFHSLIDHKHIESGVINLQRLFPPFPGPIREPVAVDRNRWLKH